MTTTENRKEISHFINQIAKGLAKAEDNAYDLASAFEEAGQTQLANRLAEGISEWLEAWTTHCGRFIEQALDAIDQEEGQP